MPRLTNREKAVGKVTETFDRRHYNNGQKSVKHLTKEEDFSVKKAGLALEKTNPAICVGMKKVKS